MQHMLHFWCALSIHISATACILKHVQACKQGLFAEYALYAEHAGAAARISSLWPQLELVMVLQIAMGAFVNYFFSGFIMGKIPFPLSPSFRLMLQVSTLQALSPTA
jgi:hypothetical protein